MKGEDMDKIREELRYCESDCEWLSPKEREQKRGEIHFCGRFGIPIKHYGAHPLLIRIESCILEKLKKYYIIPKQNSIYNEKIISGKKVISIIFIESSE